MNSYSPIRPHQRFMLMCIGRALLTVGLIALAGFMVTSFRMPPAGSNHDEALHVLPRHCRGNQVELVNDSEGHRIALFSACSRSRAWTQGTSHTDVEPYVLHYTTNRGRRR